jgi:histidinol-phosphate aminotransferase
MSWLKKIVRSEILNLKAYNSARSEYAGDGQIQLDANESPIKPYGQNTDGLNRYPEPQSKKLLLTLANIYGVRADQMLITRGADEAIDLLIRTFCTANKDAITITPPTYGYYEVAANINNVAITKIDLLPNFEPRWDRLKKVKNSKLFFLCNPNNPTGNLMSLKDIKSLCQQYKDRAIIVIDEAYIEFEEGNSATIFLAEYKNLVIMRTLSKAYGLAANRIGAIIADPDIIDLLRKVIQPYPIPAPCVKIALDSLSPIGLIYTRKNIEQIKQQREYLYQNLKNCKKIKKIYQTSTNFILLIAKDAKILYQELKSTGIIIRDRTQDIAGALRISVGTPQENQLLLAALGLIEYKSDFTRKICKIRKTKETEIMCEVNFDNKGSANIKTSIGFFDHMLEQLARHSGISIDIKAIGDIHIDTHHTIEDVAIVLGLALKEVLGDKKGINRYGFLLPMDEAEAKVSIDLAGRGYCKFEAIFQNPLLGDLPSEMIRHFFETLSINMAAAIHISATGQNTHHMVEAIFKCVAKALKQAIAVNGDQLPSTKGVL